MNELKCTNESIVIVSPKMIIRGPQFGCTELRKDDWLFCDKGEKMQVFGFDEYLLIHPDSEEVEIYVEGSNTDTVIGRLGRVKVLENQVAVFKLNDLLDYNLYFTKWWECHSHYATVIKHFTGTVKVVDNELIGKGEHLNFISYAGKRDFRRHD